MEEQEQIRHGCLFATLQYLDPVIMELQLSQEEQLNYTHKFFVKIRDIGALVYRVNAGKYEITEDVALQSYTQSAKSKSDDGKAKTHTRPDMSVAADQIDEPPIEMRALQYQAQPPLFTFEQLVVPDTLMEDLRSVVEILHLERQVFDEWGLRKIEPFPHSALNFHGPPGTGKTLAAHAIAHSLSCPILNASYAEIESKFHGEGPKNIKALFYAAERDGAVLFIDEADSLLSKRLTEVTQGAEQAINSMRSQLFICLQEFHGVAIFATNLVENYDKAFDTRVRSFRFSMPDQAARTQIWRNHLVPQLPLAEDVSIERLALYAEDVCGRDIKNAIIDAAVKAAQHRKSRIDYHDLTSAIDRIREERISTT
jgi:ATP-dependent 26S proteasome regulatory subunit